MIGCVSCKDDASKATPAIPLVTSPPEAGPFINATALPSASVAAIVNPTGAAAYVGPTGSLEGTVSITGDFPPTVTANFSKCLDAEKTYGKLFREGAGRALADAVVALSAYPDQYLPARSETESVIIRGCGVHDKRTIAMTFGQRLDVKNNGFVLLAPQLEQAPAIALMMAPPGGEAVRLYPPKLGRYRLIDKSGRDYMSADVLVSPHPLHAVTSLEGHYRIDGIPVGPRKVQAYHPAIGDGPKGVVRDVQIAPGVVQKLDLVLSFSLPPDGGMAPTRSTADAGRPPQRIH